MNRHLKRIFYRLFRLNFKQETNSFKCWKAKSLNFFDYLGQKCNPLLNTGYLITLNNI